MWTTPRWDVTLDERFSASETIPEGDDTGGHLLSAFPEPRTSPSLKDYSPPLKNTEEMEEKLSSVERRSGETWRLFPKVQ